MACIVTEVPVLSCRSLPCPSLTGERTKPGCSRNPTAPFIPIFSLSLSNKHTQGVPGGEGRSLKDKNTKPKQQDITNGQFRSNPSCVEPETYDTGSLFKKKNKKLQTEDHWGSSQGLGRGPWKWGTWCLNCIGFTIILSHKWHPELRFRGGVEPENTENHTCPQMSPTAVFSVSGLQQETSVCLEVRWLDITPRNWEVTWSRRDYHWGTWHSYGTVWPRGDSTVSAFHGHNW